MERSNERTNVSSNSSLENLNINSANENIENSSLRTSVLALIYKNIFKIILLIIFIIASIVYIDHYLLDKKEYSNYIDKTMDKCASYLEIYFNVFDDVDYLVTSKRSASFYQDKVRNLINEDDEDKINDDFSLSNYNADSYLEVTLDKNSGDNKSLVIGSKSIINDRANNSSLVEENSEGASNTYNETYYDYKYYLVYEFVKNITLFPYKGKWSNLKVDDNIFENLMGTAEVEIIKNFTYQVRVNYISNIEAIQALFVSAYLRDGDYRDNYLNMNMTLSFPENFSYYLYDTLQESTEKESKGSNLQFAKSKLVLSYKNMTVNFIQGEIFGENNVTVCNQSEVDVEFIRGSKLMKKNFDNQMIIEFSEMNIQIRDRSCHFSVDMTLTVDENENFEARIWNYSLIITAISIVEIYLTLKLLYEVSENDQIGKNICLITLSMNIMWNSFLCTIHFYLSITNEDFSYEYGTPSMTYFLLFSVFELRLLFFVWRARYHHLAYTDLALFRRKLLRFYSTFYIFLFVGLLSIRYMFTNFWTCYFLFASTWIFQILHSIYHGTKPPYNMTYVFMLSLGKLFAPLYIKACPYNIFELKPAYWKMSIFVITILIEIGIMALQKVVGPRFLVPSCLKKKPYNYYHEMDNEEIRNRNLNTECVICLDLLIKPIEEITNDNQPINNVNKDGHNLSLFSLYHKITTKFALWVESLKHTYNKKKYMITPCNHVFHTHCMERWMEMKNECPYCRRPTPPLE